MFVFIWLALLVNAKEVNRFGATDHLWSTGLSVSGLTAEPGDQKGSI